MVHVIVYSIIRDSYAYARVTRISTNSVKYTASPLNKEAYKPVPHLISSHTKMRHAQAAQRRVLDHIPQLQDEDLEDYPGLLIGNDPSHERSCLSGFQLEGEFAFAAGQGRSKTEAWLSRPGISAQPLAELDVTVSPSSSSQKSRILPPYSHTLMLILFPVGSRALIPAAPLLQVHYRLFITTTSSSIP